MELANGCLPNIHSTNVQARDKADSGLSDHEINNTLEIQAVTVSNKNIACKLNACHERSKVA